MRPVFGPAIKLCHLIGTVKLVYTSIVPTEVCVYELSESLV